MVAAIWTSLKPQKAIGRAHRRQRAGLGSIHRPRRRIRRKPSKMCLEALSGLHREAGGLGLEFSVDGLFVIGAEEVTV